MEIPAYFQTIAEIGLGLAGFSGLIVALRKDSGPLTDIQKYRMSILFALSFGAVFLSFMPNLYVNLGLPDLHLWTSASTMLAIYSSWFLYWWLASSNRVSKVAPEIFSSRAFITMTTGHVIVLLLQLGVIAGYGIDSQAGVFSLGLIWYLINGSQQFVRMLFIQPKTDMGSRADSDPKR